jgi:hypothetical protein
MYTSRAASPEIILFCAAIHAPRAVGEVAEADAVPDADEPGMGAIRDCANNFNLDLVGVEDNTTGPLR